MLDPSYGWQGYMIPVCQPQIASGSVSLVFGVLSFHCTSTNTTHNVLLEDLWSVSWLHGAQPFAAPATRLMIHT